MVRLRETIRWSALGMLIVGLGVCSISGATTSKTTGKKSITHAQKTSQKSTATNKSSKAVSARRGKQGKRASSRKERGQKAPTSERVTEIQTALAKDGSFTGTPNGKWDANTVEAMKKFQASHGLNPSGKLEAKTLQKLGLGSQTAGLAAPVPPVRVSSNTDTQTQLGKRQ